MLTLVDEPRSFRSIRNIEESEKRAEEILHADSASLQTIVDNCSDLSREWRALVKEISDDLENGIDLDLRKLGSIALPMAVRSLKLFESVEGLIRSTSASVKNAGDVTLAAVECRNIVRWIKQWPAADSSIRQRALEALQSPECEYATNDDFR